MLTPDWQTSDGSVMLYRGDCLDIIPRLGVEVDAVVTDPPYGVGFSGKTVKPKVGGGAIRYTEGYEGFDDTPEYIETVCVPAIKMCIDIAQRVAVTTGNRCMRRYPEPRDIGCFFNPAGTGRGPWGFGCMSLILYYGACPYLANGLGNRPSSTQQQANDHAAKTHPCAKPYRTWKWLVERASLSREAVLDPFMGSGTTGSACVNTGRRFIGIELSEQYFEAAKVRIQAQINANTRQPAG